MTFQAMQAIMYAAGVGMRLKSAFGERPKILLEFGGKSLLEWHLVRLAEAGVKELTLVTGYQCQLIDQALPALRERCQIAITTLNNPDFTEGSILSLAASIPALQALPAGEPVLLMDADVLYPPEFLRRLVGSPHRTALLIDRDYSTADDDPVLVPIAKGRPFDFVKNWKGEAESVGESIGFFKLAAADVRELISLTQTMSVGAGRSASYDDILRRLVQAGRFGHEDVTGLPWTEIDFPSDVDRATREVLPALSRRQDE
jgi:choline kinase